MTIIYNGWTESPEATKRRWQRIRRQYKTAFERELERYYSECTCEPWAVELCDSCKRANQERLKDEIPY